MVSPRTRWPAIENWCGRYVSIHRNPKSAGTWRKHIEPCRRNGVTSSSKSTACRAATQAIRLISTNVPKPMPFSRESVSDPYSLCIEALRKGIGPDRIFLACRATIPVQRSPGPIRRAWAPTSFIPTNLPIRENYLNQARITQSQLFTHKRDLV